MPLKLDRHERKIGLLSITIAVGCVMAGIATGLRSLGGGIVHSPEAIELTNEVIEGEVYQVPVHITNNSAIDVSLVSVTPTCACISLDQPASHPFDIPFGEDVLMTLALDTTGMIGRFETGVETIAKTAGGEAYAARFSLSYFSRCVLHPVPERVAWGPKRPGDTCYSEIELASMEPVSVASDLLSVTTSDSTLLEVNVVEADNATTVRGQDAVAKYLLKVQFRIPHSTDGQSHQPFILNESIHIETKVGERIAKKSIPVVCRVVPEIQLFPESLVLVGDAGDVISREVECIVSDLALGRPEPVETPRNCEVQVLPVGPDRWRLSVSVTLTSDSDSDAGDIKLRFVGGRMAAIRLNRMRASTETQRSGIPVAPQTVRAN